MTKKTIKQYNKSKKILRMLFNTIKLFTAYQLLDDGVSNFLGLQTLRHGTSPYNYCKIQLEGAQPKYGGSGFGSEPSNSIRARKKFYICKDILDEAWIHQKMLLSNPQGNICDFFGNVCNEWAQQREKYNNETDSCWTLTELFALQMKQSMTARSFGIDATLSAYHRFVVTNIIDLSKNPLSPLQEIVCKASFVGALAIANISPLVRFHFTDKQIKENIKTGRFQDDPLLTYNVYHSNDLQNLTFFTAFTTEQAIDTSFLGISGSLRQGVNTDTLENMKNHPYKVLYGSACLASSTFIDRSLYQKIIGNKPCQTPPASLAKKSLKKLKNAIAISGMLLFDMYH